MGTQYSGDYKRVAILDAWIKLSRAGITVTQKIRPSVEKSNLTMAQFGVLEMLLHLGPLSQKVIGLKILRSPGNVVMVIDNLVRDGLVRRNVNPHDRRSHIVELLPIGRSLIEKVFEKHVQALEQAFEALNSAEVRVLGRLCKKLGLGIDAT
ncbi:MAG: MarR family transcriptional regulator [Candidatus Marinimicrobia bacterium]|nr:MarR family transcriptional regulator [Candidatus Neomarinimicrobiota bacterium]